jgi:hypothetical protein
MGKQNSSESWINRKWRPAMGWMYMTVCIFDFILFPIMFTIVQFWEFEAANDAFRQWEPITMTGAGLFHLAMGAVLGITAWSRGQEKMTSSSFGPMGMGMSHNHSYNNEYVSQTPIKNNKPKHQPRPSRDDDDEEAGFDRFGNPID